MTRVKLLKDREHSLSAWFRGKSKWSGKVVKVGFEGLVLMIWQPIAVSPLLRRQMEWDAASVKGINS